MIKYIHFISRNKERKPGSVEFQVVSFTNKIRRLLHIWNCTEKIIYLREVYEKFGKTSTTAGLFVKQNRVRYKELINQAIRELKTQRIKEKLMKRPVTGKDLMIVNMGPHHHPCTCSSLIVTLDGEDVVDCEPILGYLHRGMEKNCRKRAIIQYLPYVTRWDYLATMFTEAITVNGPEQLGNIQVPKRASYIRVIMLELSRIASLCYGLALYGRYWGTDSLFLYFQRTRIVYDLFEAATGMRMMHNFFRIGGIAADLPYEVVEYQKLLHETYFLERVEGVGIIGGEEAINWGLSGPMLRASGIPWDLRKVDRYESYDEFEWEIQWQKQGDSLARYLVRLSEMTESIKLFNRLWKDFRGKKPSPTFELSKQELYVRVEAPKGELGIFLIGDQSGFLGDGKSDRRVLLICKFFLN
ncbi:hypothetical protein HID58_090139 [Brassica napus]|uniref:NADH-quinone oxidoreductase subunit D domain-containing protein n=1 Tax=Brassica napus TaxID=3708 RepID=A0ABQ7XE20_BRANA|nr:hypothetical protein HID58_090139 [Brassica napus]